MSLPADIREINRAVIEEFRANGGKVDRPGLQGSRLVLLTTNGLKTGRAYTTPLGAFDDGPGRFFLWASAMGAPSHPTWYRNLEANPHVTIELGTEAGTVARFEATATVARDEERDRLLASLAESRPRIAAHQDSTDREIPIVVVEYDPAS
jgi:deazaflavin-dependent oxidoreductase (nitroreductase family)